jgi:hypothetical protein
MPTDFDPRRASEWIEAITVPCYVAGRMIAVLDYLEYQHQGDAATDILARFPTTPVEQWVRLNKLVQRELTSVRPLGRRSALRHLVTRIGANVGTDFPRTRLDAEEAAELTQGYYAQRAHLMGSALVAAKTTYEEALEAAKQAAAELIESGVSEAEAARTVGLNRMTVRKAQGKQ